MDFGMFLEQTRRGTGQADAFQEMFELVDAAEAWGLDIVWLAEMLINPARSVLSAPLLVASWIVARTRRVRVGTAVQLLPLNHPLRVAGEVTTLDHLSQGRFDFGIGRSGGRAPTTPSASRTRRARRASSRRWRSSSRPGRASPSATTASSIGSPTSPSPRARTSGRIRRCGWPPPRRRRFPAWPGWACRSSSGCAAWTFPSWPATCGVYREAWRDAGHPGDGDACLRIPIYAAPTEKAAREEPRDTITYYFERQADLTLAPIGRAGTGPVERRQTQAQRLARLSYEEILDTKVAFGTGPALIDRLGQLREELAVTGVAAELNPGGLLPTAQELRSLEILTKQVMPAFK